MAEDKMNFPMQAERSIHAKKKAGFKLFSISVFISGIAALVIFKMQMAESDPKKNKVRTTERPTGDTSIHPQRIQDIRTDNPPPEKNAPYVFWGSKSGYVVRSDDYYKQREYSEKLEAHPTVFDTLSKDEYDEKVRMSTSKSAGWVVGPGTVEKILKSGKKK